MTDYQKKFENLIAELRISGMSVEQIRDLFEDSLSLILSDEKDGENLGRYS